MLSLLALLLAATPAAGPPCPPPAGLEAWTAPTTVADGAIELGSPLSLALQARPTADQPASHAGSARLVIAAAGTYRVAIDQRAWIDVLADGKPLAAIAHQRGPSCGSIVKTIDFRLPAGTYQLAISRAARSNIRVLVVRSSGG